MTVWHPAPVRRRPKPCSGPAAAVGPALLLLIAATAPAAALTLAEAERIAIARDAVLRQLGAESLGMRERAVAEGQLADPRLRLGAVNLPVDSFDPAEEDMSMLEVGVSQELPARGTRDLARQRMEQSAAAAEAVAQDRRLLVRREVRRAWVELAYLAAARRRVQGQVEWVEQMRSAARARYAAGEGRQLELLQAGLDAATLRERLLDLERDEAVRRAQLARWTGAELARLAAPDTVPARRTLEPLAALEARQRHHPAQLDYERRIEAAESATALAERRRRPGWMLDLSYGLRSGRGMDGESRPDVVSAMVSVDLPVARGSRQDREVAAARAAARGLHEMHEDHRREMAATLAEAWSVARRTAELEQYYESELLPLAEQSVQAALLAYRSSRATIDEVVAARRASLDASLGHLRLAADRAQAQYDIEYLAGGADHE